MRFPRCGIWLLGAAVGMVASAQTQVDLRTQSKSVDFSGMPTKPFQMGTQLAGDLLGGADVLQYGRACGHELLCLHGGQRVDAADPAYSAGPDGTSGKGAHDERQHGVVDGFLGRRFGDGGGADGGGAAELSGGGDGAGERAGADVEAARHGSRERHRSRWRGMRRGRPGARW